MHFPTANASWPETPRFTPLPGPGDEAFPIYGLGFRTIIESVVMSVFGVPPLQLQGTNRGRKKVALARQTAMYLAHTGFSLTLTEVGILFERDRTTVAHACAHIEDCRDDPHFDRAVELLDRAVRALRHRWHPDQHLNCA